MRCRWYNGRGGPAREPARRRKSRRAGGENTSPLGGDVSGYGTCHRRGGGVVQTPIRFGAYNIRNGQNGGLELALKRLGQ